jgi:hypothetical protein
MSQVGLDGLDGQLIIVTSPGAPQELGLPPDVRVLTEQDRAVSQALSVLSAPFAVAVDPDGIVKAVDIPNTIKQITSLVADRVHD